MAYAYVVKVFATKLVAIYPTQSHTALDIMIHFDALMDIMIHWPVILAAISQPKAFSNTSNGLDKPIVPLW